MKSIIVILTLSMFLFGNTSEANAWGPITHAEINRQASEEAYTSAFINGGHSPDIIALYHVTTGDSRYDYAHNPFGDNSAAFGETMLQTVWNTRYPERYSQDDVMFAAGWLAHQLADGVAHGPSGYVATKVPFNGAPESFKSALGHGAAELIVDALVLRDLSSGPLQITARYHTELIHEAAVRFYNDHIGETDRASIISCSVVEHLTYAWEGWLETNKYLAQLALSQAWFKQAGSYYLDFQPYFDRSIQLVRQRNKTSSLLDRLLEPLTGRVAYAASDDPPEAGYYRFVLAVSERARELGGGNITPEALSLALREVITGDLAGQKSDEVKVWAKLMQEMYLKDNKDWNDVVKNTERFAKKIDRQKLEKDGREQAGDDSEGTGLFWLLPIGAVSVAVALLVGLVRSR